MRYCYYVPKPRTSLLRYLLILPDLAIPIKLQPHTAVPLTDTSEQTLSLGTHIEENPSTGSTSEPYNAHQSRNAISESITPPLSTDYYGATNINDAHEFPHPQELSAVSDDWLTDEILCDSAEEPDISYLLHLCNDQQEHSDQDLPNEVLQKYETLLEDLESFEDVKCITPSDSTLETEESAQEVLESQNTHEWSLPQKPVHSTHTLPSEQKVLNGSSNSKFRTPSSEVMDVEDTEVQKVPSSNQIASDRDPHLAPQTSVTDSRSSTSSFEHSQEHARPCAKQPQSPHPKAGMTLSDNIDPPSARSTSRKYSLSTGGLGKTSHNGAILLFKVPTGALSNSSPALHKGSQGLRIDTSRLKKVKLVLSPDKTWSIASAHRGHQSARVEHPTKHALRVPAPLSTSCTEAERKKNQVSLADVNFKEKKTQHLAIIRKCVAQDEVCPISPKRARCHPPSAPSPLYRPEAICESETSKGCSDYNITKPLDVAPNFIAQSLSLTARKANGDVAAKARARFDKLVEAILPATQTAGRLMFSERHLKDVMRRLEYAEIVAHMKRVEALSLTRYEVRLPGPDFPDSAIDLLLCIIRRVGHWSRVIKSLESEGTPHDAGEQVKRKFLKMKTGGRIKRVVVDMVRGTAFYCLFRKSTKGESFLQTLHGLSDSNPMQQRWKEFVKSISAGLYIKKGTTLMDLEPLLICAFIYTIVAENMDVRLEDFRAERMGSEEFAEVIVTHAEDVLNGLQGLKMSDSLLYRLKEKCQWVSLLDSEFNPEPPLAADEEKALTHTSDFHLEKIARLFRSIATLSTTVSSVGKFNRKKVRQVIVSSKYAHVKEWLEELAKLSTLSKVIDTQHYGRRDHLEAWEVDIVNIMRRFQAWLRILTCDEAVDEQLMLSYLPRSMVREFVDVLGLFTRTLTFPECVKALQKLLPLVTSIIEACRASPRVNDHAEQSCTSGEFLEAVTKSRIARELLLCSTLYYILIKNIEFSGKDFFDYSVLTEEDITALCNQAQRYLANVRPSPNSDLTEGGIILPEADLARITERLRRRAR